MGATETAIQTVKKLVEASASDTLYRDLYLRRARDFFSSVLSRNAYLALKANKAEIETVLRQSDTAVERGDWSRARDLAVRMKALRNSIEAHVNEFEMARQIYEPSEVELDPFSPGLSSLVPGINPEEARNRVVAALMALERDDAAWRDFYALRRSTFRRANPAAPTARESERPDPRNVKQEALKALAQGDVEEFDRLLARMNESILPSPRGATVVGNGGSSGHHVNLAKPFPEGATKRASALGLAVMKLQPGQQQVTEYWQRLVAKSASESMQFTQDGGLQLAGLPDPEGFAGATPKEKAQLKETLSLFLVHTFVNSAGARYLPHLVMEEVLVEEFPEGNPDHPDAGLLALLGLPRRGALSRMTIEQSLLDRGSDVLQNELGLDPHEFRLVCIPFDIYSRLGRDHGWGEQRHWTHFDGYQVVTGGNVRALVGGDTRYGGLLDLCSISTMDEREGVTVRFAVVRRERLQPD